VRAVAREIDCAAASFVVEKRPPFFVRRPDSESSGAPRTPPGEVRLWTRERAVSPAAARSRSARPVRRPDLDEARARADEHLGDTEPVPDLDQLTARDDDLAPLGERREREQNGSSVVDEDRRLAESCRELRDVLVAGPLHEVGSRFGRR
jgi:hypothetical protein